MMGTMLTKSVFIIILLGIAGTAAIFGVSAYISYAAKPAIYADISQIPPTYTALILGAKVHGGGRLSNMLEDRVLTGLALYRQGKVKKLLLSGDHGQQAYDEVNAMREYLLKQGVPAQDIFMDHAGFDTYSSMYRARDVFQVRDVIVVTQAFHLPRAVFLARSLGLDAVGLAADRRTYTQASRLKAAVREPLARVKSFAEALLRVKPKYLGDAIPITGDGRQTLG
ncbi:hypothetical protein U14_00007 [Candidatus Moduliflexus flocculans]|uniref:DUF218 domain-containing protein n=1 Tax=Candidatus Moduliflexus flocculans TaxID=1499966 RepID=A0A0S6VPF4_9BACT|nr:hypothetical protein U14_00007 [Candidatus Moduliflexus flocculans]